MNRPRAVVFTENPGINRQADLGTFRTSSISSLWSIKTHPIYPNAVIGCVGGDGKERDNQGTQRDHQETVDLWTVNAKKKSVLTEIEHTTAATL